jgi:hypothetical protein
MYEKEELLSNKYDVTTKIKTKDLIRNGRIPESIFQMK